ncbi:phosphatidylethanolamine-binding protein [Kalaharituber pfeilii]|nr:phosphatidylethanolamine-binding protein [Kalaharituber pfeilii]
MAGCAKPAPSFIRALARPKAVSSSPLTPLCCAGVSQHRTLRMRPQKPVERLTDKKGRPIVTKTIESMPFQAYQLALQVIREDRQEKLKQIELTRQRLATARKAPGATEKSRTVLSLKRHLEKLRILADINNPRVKYNFDNGIIGLNKPVYRYLLDKKWRETERPILMQRLTQMHVIPDVLPYIDPVVDVQVRFKGRDVKPGTILNTLRTEVQPTVKIIPFRYGEMLCTIAVVDPDVPDPERDTFRYRLHWLVCNIPISHIQTQAIGQGAKKSDFIMPYLPPHVQKGIQYHRYAMFVFRQQDKINAEELKGKIDRDKFNMRSFQSKQDLHVIGAFMWRNEFDEHTKEVMDRHGLEGADIMWERVKD